MNNCLECQKETKNPKYCSSSCAAKSTNRNRVDKCPNKFGIKEVKCCKDDCQKIIVINLRASVKDRICDDCILVDKNCAYCSDQAKFKLKNGKFCCQQSWNSCPANKENNSKGLKFAYSIGRRSSYFKSEDRIKSHVEQIRVAKENAFGPDVLNLGGNAKKYLMEERGKICEECGIIDWNGKKIIFEIDHIDGNRHNNCKDNLRILCPNCHSQTETYRGRNNNNGKRKHSEDKIIETFKLCGNIHKTLIELEMAPKGANYNTIRTLLTRHKIAF